MRRGVGPVADLGAELERIAAMTIDELRTLWRARSGQGPPESFSKDLVARALAYRVQEQHLGGLDRQMRKLLASLATSGEKPPRRLKVGSVIIREHQGVTHEVLVVPGGFCWRGKTYSSLSTIAKAITGTTWNGPRFFGLKNGDEPITRAAPAKVISTSGARPTFSEQPLPNGRPSGTPRQPATAPRKLASPRRSLFVVATGRTKSVALNPGGDL
jgi:hypothetical protein